MQILHLRLLLTLSLNHLIVITAFLTHESIRNLTAATDDCRERITELDGGRESVLQILGGPGGGQVVLRSGHEEGDREEVEITVAAALRFVCSDLLIELEKPESTETPGNVPKCQIIVKEWHEFLGATVKFLHVIQERQMLWNWSGDSAVFDGISWLQGLWASRSRNKQQQSFIEQQMVLYDYKGSKSCFGKSEEVLERGVEIVEYMNDLIDTFN